jgi:hypothetical protein
MVAAYVAYQGEAVSLQPFALFCSPSSWESTGIAGLPRALCSVLPHFGCEVTVPQPRCSVVYSVSTPSTLQAVQVSTQGMTSHKILLPGGVPVA